jgi:hypothetical protein
MLSTLNGQLSLLNPGFIDVERVTKFLFNQRNQNRCVRTAVVNVRELMYFKNKLYKFSLYTQDTNPKLNDEWKNLVFDETIALLSDTIKCQEFLIKFLQIEGSNVKKNAFFIKISELAESFADLVRNDEAKNWTKTYKDNQVDQAYRDLFKLNVKKPDDVFTNAGAFILDLVSQSLCSTLGRQRQDTSQWKRTIQINMSDMISHEVSIKELSKFGVRRFLQSYLYTVEVMIGQPTAALSTVQYLEMLKILPSQFQPKLDLVEIRSQLSLQESMTGDSVHWDNAVKIASLVVAEVEEHERMMAEVLKQTKKDNSVLAAKVAFITTNSQKEKETTLKKGKFNCQKCEGDGHSKKDCQKYVCTGCGVRKPGHVWTQCPNPILNGKYEGKFVHQDTLKKLQDDRDPKSPIVLSDGTVVQNPLAQTH